MVFELEKTVIFPLNQTYLLNRTLPAVLAGIDPENRFC